MDKWQTILQTHKSGDCLVPIPADVVNNNDFRSGDFFIGETNIDGSFSLRRAVRISRLIREWNKYQRRIGQFGHIFIVLQSNKPIAEIGPPAKVA